MLDIEGIFSSILTVILDQPEAFCKCYDLTPDVMRISEAKEAPTNAITCIHYHQNFRLVVVFFYKRLHILVN